MTGILWWLGLSAAVVLMGVVAVCCGDDDPDAARLEDPYRDLGDLDDDLGSSADVVDGHAAAIDRHNARARRSPRYGDLDAWSNEP